ncbi:L-rhamnose mutarotase [Cyclobacteriaceae bacterium]|jgi:L-rhamnose mutarotase|nr:L-rhamnose mutarotase [Cyclobacteriaceae bacterium]|tara:strand:- start:19198 stop:19680 length:483 start_codon:yes stop_codon:yes gene_type:complete
MSRNNLTQYSEIYRKVFKYLKILFLCLLFSCKSKSSEPVQQNRIEKTIDYIFTCNLKDNGEIISSYKSYHSAEGVWPEVTRAAEVSGADKIQIYIQATRLVMVISLPEILSFEEFDRRYAGASPKLNDWNEIMVAFQQGPPGAEKDQTWVQMENIYDFKK